jgi:hypothetical protein
MAFSAAGLRKVAHGGTDGSGADSQKAIYSYVSNDADTVIETDGYFDGQGLTPGDVIIGAIDLDGTAEVKMWVVTGTEADAGLTAMIIV